LEAGAAAGLHEGMTLLELGSGNGSVAVFLAEEFHIYVRGVESHADLVESAREHAERSPAAARIRFFHDDDHHPDAGLGPVDAVVALRGPADLGLVRPGGVALLGHYRVPGEVAALFSGAVEVAEPEWSREASPLEWERYYAPQERALRVYRRGLAEGDPVSPIAIVADDQIQAFRRHGAEIAFVLSVVRAER